MSGKGVLSLSADDISKAVASAAATGSNAESGSTSPSRRARESVTVRVPATTANMGPGYDVIGMALDLWNELTVERAEKFEFLVQGEGEEALPRDESNLVVIGLEAAVSLGSSALCDVCASRTRCPPARPPVRPPVSNSSRLVSSDPPCYI